MLRRATAALCVLALAWGAGAQTTGASATTGAAPATTGAAPATTGAAPPATTGVATTTADPTTGAAPGATGTAAATTGLPELPSENIDDDDYVVESVGSSETCGNGGVASLTGSSAYFWKLEQPTECDGTIRELTNVETISFTGKALPGTQCQAAVYYQDEKDYVYNIVARTGVYTVERTSVHTMTLYADTIDQIVFFSPSKGAKLAVGLQCNQTLEIALSKDEDAVYVDESSTVLGALFPPVLNPPNVTVNQSRADDPFEDPRGGESTLSKDAPWGGLTSRKRAHIEISGIFPKKTDNLCKETGDILAILFIVIGSIIFALLGACAFIFGPDKFSTKCKAIPCCASKRFSCGSAFFVLFLLILMGASVMDNLHPNDDDWGFGNSFYWGIVTVTTVGYGDISVGPDPLTQWFVMFYIGFGFIVGAVTLGHVVTTTANVIAEKKVHGEHNCLKRCWECEVGCCQGKKLFRGNDSLKLKLASVFLPVLVFVYAGIMYAFEQDPCSFLFNEDDEPCDYAACKDESSASYVAAWTYTNSLYFVIKTLSTVGYGDYSPRNPGSKVAACILMLFGVVMFSFVLGAVAEYLKDKIATKKKKTREELEKELAEVKEELEMIDNPAVLAAADAVAPRRPDGSSENSEEF